MADFRPCIIMPVYNHGVSAGHTVNKLLDLGLRIFLIDDGSTIEVSALDDASTASEVELLRHDKNLGKGSAVITGLRAAQAAGFSHALQIDADGQHAVEDIPKFLVRGETETNAVFCGRPVFDDTVPLGRLVGRYMTHVWVWIETLSFEIQDSMCGFRLYPLAETIPILNHKRLGQGMDFDTEVLVRLSWAGVSICFIPTKVVYPEGGRSNFRLLADNWLITKMHTRLFLGMLLRLPRLFWNKPVRRI